MQAKIIFYETICGLNFLEVVEKLFIYLAIGRKIKYVKHKHLYSDDNITNVEFMNENKKKREIMEINSIEILICCLTVVPSNLLLICRSSKKLYLVERAENQRIFNAK